MGIFSEIDLDRTIVTDDDEKLASQALEQPGTLTTTASTQMPAPPSQEEGNSPAETINPPSEDEKRKAHEEAEAKRKAEWEAKKREREEADTMAWEAAIAMDDDALMEASSNRLAADAERITRRNMKQCVTEYVQALCYENLQFAQQAMHPRKSMINCFKYINRKAMEFVKQEMEDNGIKPTNEGYGCDVPDDLCYQWAVDYFNDMEAPEDKKEGEEDFVPKPYTGYTPKKTTKTKTEKKAAKPKKAEEKPTEVTPTVKQSDGQLSFFNMEVA